jgi:hypothetical protein
MDPGRDDSQIKLQKLSSIRSTVTVSSGWKWTNAWSFSHGLTGLTGRSFA